MGLMDEFTAEPVGPRRKCPVYRMTEQIMDEAELDDFMQAVKSESIIPARVISRVMDRKGFSITAEAIGRHRRGECGCRGK